MDTSTPEGLEPDAFGFGGNGKVVVWALLENDDDGEMLGMTELLTTLLTKTGKLAGCIETRGCVSGDGLKLGGGRSICVTGHSRFMDADGNFIPMPDRRLGGFKVDDVIDELACAIENFGISYIEFWCCETACKQHSAEWQGGGTGKSMSLNCGMRTLKQISLNVGAKSWSQVSTLEYICLKLSLKLYEVPFMDFKLHITGLNGVGYICPGDRQIVTFDQAQILHTVKNIGELEVKIANKTQGQHDQKNLDLAKKRLGQHITKRGCHYVVGLIDTAVMRRDVEERKAQLKAERKAKMATEGDDADMSVLPKGPGPGSGPGSSGAGLSVGSS